MKFSKQDVRSPYDFEQMATLVRPDDFEGRMVISADPDAHRAEIQRFLDARGRLRSTSTTSAATRPSGWRSSAATCCRSCIAEVGASGHVLGASGQVVWRGLSQPPPYAEAMTIHGDHPFADPDDERDPRATAARPARRRGVAVDRETTDHRGRTGSDGVVAIWSPPASLAMCWP